MRFQHESGKHVVQRCPPTENKGRRHTSTISVSILPILGEQDHSLNEKDIEIKTQRGHGKGGQHQNTTDSAVRMKHVPTDISVFINGRDQHANRREARSILESRVADFLNKKSAATLSANKKEQVDGGGRGNKTRTYNFINNRVVDHQLGTKTSKIKQIMRGEFQLLWP